MKTKKTIAFKGINDMGICNDTLYDSVNRKSTIGNSYLDKTGPYSRMVTFKKGESRRFMETEQLMELLMYQIIQIW